MTRLQKKYKVLIVDDSALIRALLTEVLSSDARIEVIAAASDPYEARELIKRHNPDVLTLDIEMPRMNGIAFLKNLMRLRPMPVIMISTLTQEGAPATLEALSLGAIDFIAKPKDEGPGGLERYRDLIVEKVVVAAQANLVPKSTNREMKSTTPLAMPLGKIAKPKFICAIGASTGGTEAIKEVITSLPATSPPIVIAQHIPETFSASFAKRVNGQSELDVCEAEHNQLIQRGGVYIAPGHSHMRIAMSAKGYVCKLDNGDLVNRHRPSVEVLFDSVLDVAGKHALGVLLTGMGADGAEALLRMKQSNCDTVAQDKETSVVWGMPGAAVNLGAACRVLALNRVANYILASAYK